MKGPSFSKKLFYNFLNCILLNYFVLFVLDGIQVELVVGMVEGAILVVDAGEGPLAQTKFVLAKALKYGLRPILLLNKVDRPAGMTQLLIKF